MKWLSRSLFLLVLVAAIVFAVEANRTHRLTPGERFAELQHSIESKSFDEQNILRSLARLLRDARAEGNEQVASGVLLARARFLLSIGAPERALEDLGLLLGGGGQDAASLQLLIAEAEVASGAVERGVERLEELTASAETSHEALIALARLKRRIAADRLARCSELMHLILPRDEARKVQVLLRELAARDMQDPDRPAVAARVQAFFEPEDGDTLSRMQALAELASGDVRDARAALARSLEIAVDSRAVSGLVDVLLEARNYSEARSLALFALAEEELLLSSETTIRLIRALAERDNWSEAGYVAEVQMRERELTDPEFLSVAAETLYRAGRWHSLLFCTNVWRTVARGDESGEVELYKSLATYGIGKDLAKAELGLRKFAVARTDEPFPGARAVVWEALADLAAKKQRPLAEREALHGSLSEDPRRSGVLWARLAALQTATPRSNYRPPVDSLLEAMRLSPELTGELMPRWREAGEKLLAWQKTDIEAMERNLQRQRRVSPKGRPDPYTRFRLAEQYLAVGRPSAANSITRLLIEDFPGFLPAEDLRVRALLGLKQPQEALTALLQRLERHSDATALALLSRIDPSQLSDEQRVRAMRSDPDHLGRIEVAHHLIERGDLEGALTALKGGKGERSPQEDYLRGRILALLGSYRTALQALSKVPITSAFGMDARRLALQTASTARRTADLERLADETLGLKLSSAERLRVAELLMRVGLIERADKVLARLEAARGPELGQAIVMRALCALRENRVDDALGFADRAEAFLAGPTPIFVRLLIMLQTKDQVGIEGMAVELLSDGASPSALPRALVALVTSSVEDLDAILAEHEFDQDSREVWELLTTGATLLREGRFDAPPRFGKTAAATRAFLVGPRKKPWGFSPFATLVFAAETPGLEAHALFLLEHTTRLNPGARLWVDWFRARILARRGELADASAILRKLVPGALDFQPGWTAYRRVEVARLGADHPSIEVIDVTRAGERRVQLTQRQEAALQQATERAKRGEIKTALASLRQLSQAMPTWTAPYLLEARVLFHTGEQDEAIAVWRRLLGRLSREEASELAPSYIAALEEAEALGPKRALDSERVEAELAWLERRTPDDPCVPLARARRAVERSRENPLLALQLALDSLEGWRKRKPGRALDSVREGSLAGWVALLKELEPRRAVELCEEELALEPGRPETWLCLGRLRREQAALDAALGDLRVLATMYASQDARLELGETMVSAGTTPALLRQVLPGKLMTAEGSDGLRARRLLAETRIRLHQASQRAPALEALAGLWSEIEALETPEQRRRVGLLYAQALVERGLDTDRVLAREVLEASLAWSRDSYEVACTGAMLGLTLGQP